MTVRASIVVPCHNKSRTLPLTVDTVLRQSVSELEVILLGDGVTEEVRGVIERLVATDQRVRFLDFPKGPHHGEKYRHDAVLAARSDAVFYLCDDDLLLPDHVADLLALLEEANVVQSLNGFVRPDGSFATYASDLANPRLVATMVRTDLRFNSVSITGTAHSKDFYLAVGAWWETTPPDQWPDHFQWRKLMSHPDFVGATSNRMTALQLPTGVGGRAEWTQQERESELATWHEVVTAPDGQQQVDALLHRGALAQLALLRARAAEGTAAQQREKAAQLAEIDQLRRRLRRARRARRQAQAEAAALRSSRSWRLTASLRSGVRVARKLKRRMGRAPLS